MSQTHTSYEFSKKLKAFLGDAAPNPMGGVYWDKFGGGMGVYLPPEERPAAYRLEDLLSKPFCEAFLKKVWDIDLRRKPDEYIDLAVDISKQYFYGGLPAVEKALIEMMEGK